MLRACDEIAVAQAFGPAWSGNPQGLRCDPAICAEALGPDELRAEC